jgi:hypothetical protein
LHGDGEAERAGFGWRKPEGLDLDRRAKIGNPNRPERLAGSSVVVSVGLLILASPSSQGFPATKHQGVFPAKKKFVSEANTSSEKNRERSANSILQNSDILKHSTRVSICCKYDKLSFVSFLFLRLKKEIEEDLKVYFWKIDKNCASEDESCASEDESLCIGRRVIVHRKTSHCASEDESLCIGRRVIVHRKTRMFVLFLILQITYLYVLSTFTMSFSILQLLRNPILTSPSKAVFTCLLKLAF